MRMTVYDAKERFGFNSCALCGKGVNFYIGNGVEGPCNHCEELCPRDNEIVDITIFEFHITDTATNESWLVKVPSICADGKLNEWAIDDLTYAGLKNLKANRLINGQFFNGFVDYEYGGENLYFFAKIL